MDSCSQSRLAQSMRDYPEFFMQATGFAPYDYQRRLACGEGRGVSAGTPCASRLIHVPTGLGKTAAVVLAWMWNRLMVEDDGNPWPTRMVYCLPMRSLVEQTCRSIENHIDRLCRAYPGSEGFQVLKELSPVVLMGGEPTTQGWDIRPERPAIVVGTQDMLLSRALNRGYGMSQFRWPMHFALLNNDCLWVLDEVQLMGVGVETSAQLAGFRESFSTLGPSVTWWMSATLDDSRLCTVDHEDQAKSMSESVIRLEEGDLHLEEIRRRQQASKRVRRSPIALEKETAKEVSRYVKRLAEWIVENHRKDTFSLVILNRVDRAQALCRELEKGSDREFRLALVHSRFRPEDRKVQQGQFDQPDNLVCVATQAVEAGMDLDAAMLVTELAPWSSLIQRFGRCNRKGLCTDATIHWMDVSEDASTPYIPEELTRAREVMERLEGSHANHESLARIHLPETPAIRPVIRKKDILDLFDTTPDLAGNHMDVSRYIRDGDQADAAVFWRPFDDDTPGKQAQPLRNELCPVSLSQLRKFLRKSSAHAWDILDGEWKEVEYAVPGGTYLLAASAGGYRPDLGWTGDAKEPKDPENPRKARVPCLPSPDVLQDHTGADPASFSGNPILLHDHTRDVLRETERLVKALELTPWHQVLASTAWWHDVGKAHPEFQAMLGRDADSPELLAKSGTRQGRCQRKFFRHELLSALAWFQVKPDSSTDTNLTAYLIASHHGKVRLSIRSLPEESREFDGKRVARGIVEGETIPTVRMGDVDLPEFDVNLDLMEMGISRNGEGNRESWLSRALSLLRALGPFRLAGLETVFRAADAVASRQREHQDHWSA